jgi:hypothetical protein
MALMFKRASQQTTKCSACDNEMVIIPPFGSPYGLKVYTCRRCGRSQDYGTVSIGVVVRSRTRHPHIAEFILHQLLHLSF